MNPEMTQVEKMVLSWTLDAKLEAIRTLIDEGKYGEALEISFILLDAPLKDGGVPSELIERAMMGTEK